MPTARTVDAMFRTAARLHPERAFLEHANGRRTSYADTARIVDVIAEQLSGLGRGDRAIFYLEAPEPSALFYLACAHLGVVPVPLSPSFSAHALEQLCARVQARLVVTDLAHADRPARSTPIVCLDEPGLPTHVRAIDVSPRRTRDEALDRLTAIATHDASACFLFQPTSGTTGEPKLIMRAHGVFDRVARVHAMGLREDLAPRLLLVAAMTHGMGQYAFATGLHLAGTLCITTHIDTAASLAEIHALATTLLWLTPRVLRALHAQRSSDAHWLGTEARVLFTGGAAADVGLLHEVEALGVAVCEGYGASEISLLSHTTPGTWREGISGKVLPDVTLVTAPDGELLARSPHGVMMGYFGDEALTHEAFTEDGYYRTGDYCDVSADGDLRYLGRKRDVFNTNEGANVHPGRIEAMIERLPGVRQCVLIGDQRPYMAALIVIDAVGANGVLDEAVHADAYARVRLAIDAMNRELEGIEQVRRFKLFDRPFDEALWRAVGHAKISRNRRLVAEQYGPFIEAMYR